MPVVTKPTVEDQLLRSQFTCVVNAARNWHSRWGWILEEYDLLSEKLKGLKKSFIESDVNYVPIIDKREVRPWPVTTQKDIGWLSGRQEFQLEIYGADLKRIPILPSTNYDNYQEDPRKF